MKVSKDFLQLSFVSLGILTPLILHAIAFEAMFFAYCKKISFGGLVDLLIIASSALFTAFLHWIATRRASELFARKEMKRFAWMAVAWWVCAYVLVSVSQIKMYC